MIVILWRSNIVIVRQHIICRVIQYSHIPSYTQRNLLYISLILLYCVYASFHFQYSHVGCYPYRGMMPRLSFLKNETSHCGISVRRASAPVLTPDAHNTSRHSAPLSTLTWGLPCLGGSIASQGRARSQESCRKTGGRKMKLSALPSP